MSAVPTRARLFAETRRFYQVGRGLYRPRASLSWGRKAGSADRPFRLAAGTFAPCPLRPGVIGSPSMPAVLPASGAAPRAVKVRPRTGRYPITECYHSPGIILASGVIRAPATTENYVVDTCRTSCPSPCLPAPAPIGSPPALARRVLCARVLSARRVCLLCSPRPARSRAR